jgi:hypothetical protein
MRPSGLQVFDVSLLRRSHRSFAQRSWVSCFEESLDEESLDNESFTSTHRVGLRYLPAGAEFSIDARYIWSAGVPGRVRAFEKSWQTQVHGLTASRYYSVAPTIKNAGDEVSEPFTVRAIPLAWNLSGLRVAICVSKPLDARPLAARHLLVSVDGCQLAASSGNQPLIETVAATATAVLIVDLPPSAKRLSVAFAPDLSQH